jgi:hypothetical protein
MRCRYRYLYGKILYSPLHCRPVKQRNRTETSIRLRNSSESAGLPLQVESRADGMGESIRRIHVDGADSVPEIAPDFDEAVLDDVGVRRFLHQCKGIRSDNGSAIKIGLKRGKFAGKRCRIKSLWP